MKPLYLLVHGSHAQLCKVAAQAVIGEEALKLLALITHSRDVSYAVAWAAKLIAVTIAAFKLLPSARPVPASSSAVP